MDLLRVPMTGGVNLLADPRNIRDDELVKAGNLVPVKPGVLQTRPAIQISGSIAGVSASNTPLAFRFGPWLDSPMFGLFYQPAAGATNPSVSVVGLTPTGEVLVPAQTLVNYGPAGDLAVRPWIMPFAGRLYFLPGNGAADFAALSIGRGEPAAVPFSFAGSNNDGLRPRVSSAYRNRVVWANFGVGYENTIVFSDNFAPGVVGNDVLAANGRNVTIVSAGDGDEIVGLVEVMLTSVGTPTQSALLVLRRYSSYLVVGEPDQTTGGTSSLEINRMSVAAGCASPWTIVSTPYGVIWAGLDDVWMFRAGQNPYPIGTKLRPALERTPRDLGYKLSASYFNGFYRLALFGEAQVTIDRTSRVLDQWWVDLRRGAPNDADNATWWGPQQFEFTDSTSSTTGGFNVVARDDRPGSVAALYGLEFAVGSDEQNTLAIIKYDTDNSYDNSISPSTLIPYDLDLTIKPDLITKEYDLGDPMVQKIYDGMEANVWASQSGRLLAQGVLDGGAQYTENNLDVTARGFEPGVDTITSDGIPMPRAPQGVAAFDVSRAVGTTVQMRLQGKAGYLVDATNDTFVVKAGPAGNNHAWRATITRGLYPTLSALMDAILVATYVDLTDADEQSLEPITGIGSASRSSEGIVSFTDAGNPGNGNIVFMFAGTTPVTGTAPTAAQIASTARLGVLMGYDTSTDQAYVGDTINVGGLTALLPTYEYTAPIWELNGLGLRLEVIPRRPS